MIIWYAYKTVALVVIVFMAAILLFVGKERWEQYCLSEAGFAGKLNDHIMADFFVRLSNPYFAFLFFVILAAIWPIATFYACRRLFGK